VRGRAIINPANTGRLPESQEAKLITIAATSIFRKNNPNFIFL
jgi:hypothetical protein